MTTVIPWTAKREITLRTLTPLWTGGATGSMDRVHETGLLGSLRWWYEALIRGVGGHACDPTNATCKYDDKKYQEEMTRTNNKRSSLRKAGVCDACQLFGATGWRRRFRLTEDGSALTEEWPDAGEPERFFIHRDGQNRTWYMRPGWHDGTLTLSFVGEPEACAVLAGVLRLIVTWAGIGARTQLGYGIVAVEAEGRTLDPAQLHGDLSAIAALGLPPGTPPSTNLPDLRRMFFARLNAGQVNPTRVIHAMLDAKYDLRRTFQDDQQLRHAIMGKVQGSNRRGSMISVSRPYQTNDGWRQRLWGWAPETPYFIVATRIEQYARNRDAAVDWRTASPPGPPGGPPQALASPAAMLTFLDQLTS